MLVRPLRAGADVEPWLALLKETYADAGTPSERTICLLVVPRHAFDLVGLGAAPKALANLDKWLEEQKRLNADSPRSVREIGMAEFYVACASRNFSRAADAAKGPGLQGLRPLALMMAGKPDDARAALEELRTDPNLSEPERGALDTTRAILDSLAPAVQQPVPGSDK